MNNPLGIFHVGFSLPINAHGEIEMPDDHMTLLERLKNPSWQNGGTTLVTIQTLMTMNVAAQEIASQAAEITDLRADFTVKCQENYGLRNEHAREIERQETAHLATIDERDEAQEAISQMYYLIIGRSPEWSNLFGVKEALEEVDDAQSLLRTQITSQAARIAALEAQLGIIK